MAAAAVTISQLPALVRKAFKEAQDSGELTFYHTKVSILQCSGFSFQVRFSPALANKPKSNKPRDPKGKQFDPFDRPSAGLFIAELPSYNIVLNKFPVIPDHFILATKDFKKQSDLLEEDDLAAAHACLVSYRENGEELFGFFNSGEHSGASQPHRHIQFLPVESMRSGVELGSGWKVLVDELSSTPTSELPFAYFSYPVPAMPDSKFLHDIYIKLHEKACLASSSSRSSLSYNLALTDRTMVLCPRKSEGSIIKDSSGNEIGSVALNGTVLGGTALVKSEAEWDALRNDSTKLLGILGAIGFPTGTAGYGEKL